MEKFTHYRICYEYMGKILNYSTAVVRDYETAKSWLEKEQETDNQAGVTSFLVKERVVRERI